MQSLSSPVVADKYFCRNRAVTIMIGMVAAISIGQIGQKVKPLLHHKQLGFKVPTSMDQGGINAPFTGIELATID